MAMRNKRGSAVMDVVIAAAIVIFVLLPVFSAVIEKYVIMEKAKMIRDAVDMTNISAYNALNAGGLGRVYADIGYSKAMEIFETLLCVNLNLDESLNPKEGSIAEGRIEIKSLELYMNGFPVECSGGTMIVKPSVHSCINIPMKPSLYRKIILSILGKEHIDILVHVDSEIPINN